MTNATRHIALVCPGAPVAEDLAEAVCAIAAARHGGRVRLHFHPQCFRTAGDCAGTDDERGAAFLEAANDPKFDAVWFARGGRGACRLNPQIFPQLNACARRKTYLGHASAGMALARLYKDGVGRPAHGPMPADLARARGEDAIGRALDYLVGQNADALEPTVRTGKKAAAFNMTILARLVGADAAPDLSGHVVMLEEAAEYLYRIDRAMFAIAADPGVRKAAGIMLGRIGDIRENDRPFGQTPEEIVQYWCARAGVAYLGRADIGHDADNKVVPFGATPTA